MTQPATEPAPDELDEMVDEAIAACGGEVRAALRVVLLAMHHQKIEIDQLSAEISQLAVHVSKGYSRGRRDRYLTRTRISGDGS